jgi:hypothetical protein
MGRITGVVAQIIDAKQVVLSVGEKEGVTPGMHFVIYEEGPAITHPETGEELERLELVKAEVEAIHVQERITLAASVQRLETEEPQVLSWRMAHESIDFARRKAEGRSELPVDRQQMSGRQSVHPIAVGDKIRQV